MRKLALTAMVGLAALTAVALTPSKADAQVSIGIGIAAPGPYVPAQYYGGGGWDRPYYRPYRPYRPGFYGGGYGPRRCWIERRWVETPWGARPRDVRICR